MSKTSSEMKERLPILQIAFLCVVECAYFYTICSIFSFAGILSVDLGWAADKNQAGFVAGWLQSSNVFGRIFTSAVWGLVAGRYGIRLVLVITLVSLLIGGILFGFCLNLIAAMCVRFILFGLLNGWMVLQGPCACATAGPERQTEVLGIIFAAASVMQLIGPAAGGWTYGIIEEFPAMMPHLIGCALSFFALTLLFVSRMAFSQPALAEPAEPVVKEKATKVTPEFSEPDRSDLSMATSLIFQWPIPLILMMRFVAGIATYTMFEAVPLWLISDTEMGGLGMTEKSVGSLLCRSGVWNIVYFTWILPWCSKCFGSRCCSIATSLIAAVTACFLPFSPNIPVANVLHLIWASALVSTDLLNATFTNNAVRPDDRLVLTGLAVTVETVGKAIGPVGASSIFAWTLKTWGWHGHGIVFFILAGLSMFQAICVLCLPSYIETGQQPQESSKTGSANV